MSKAATPPVIEPVPLRRRTQWLVISYDVTDDKRRTKIMNTLAGHGRRVQYSVFECELRPDVLEKLVRRLQALIDTNQDDIRIYPLCENCLGKVQMLGRAQRHEAATRIIL